MRAPDLDKLRLPRTVFTELCSGPVSPTGMTVLRTGQYSLRKLRLRTLLDAIPATRHRLGPFTPIERAWAVITEAERRDPATVEDVLMTPSLGVWLSRALRHALGRPPDHTSSQLEIGWLHAVAAATAIRCGVTTDLPVPVIHGAVFLPTVGRYQIPTSFPTGHAQVTVTSTHVTVTACRGTVTCPAPQPTHQHHSTARGTTLTATIDTVDPYRTFDAPTPADHPDPTELATWTKQLDEAWELLTHRHPGQAEELAAGLATLVPLPAKHGVFAASSSAAFGSIAMSPKRTATECAEALIHELQHSKLNALFDLVQLCQPRWPTLHYAPWRDEPRPLFGMLHGIYAFMSVVEFWHVQRDLVPPADTRRAHLTYGYRANQLNRVLDVLANATGLTELGRELVAGVTHRLARHLPTNTPPDLAATIDKLTTDHYATWRLRHVRPAPHLVTDLARRWLADEPPGSYDRTGSVVQTRPSRPSARATLFRVHALEPHRFDRLPQDGPDPALVRGEHDLATTGYLAQIETTPSDVTAWAGLALATRSPALLHIPELARATYHRVASHPTTTPSPLDIATWLDDTAPTTAVESLRDLS